MIQSWLKNHDIRSYRFDCKQYPPASDRTFWESKQDQSCPDTAEFYLDFAWPIIKATDFMEFKKTGNRLIMEWPHFDRRRALTALVAGELMEYKGRFLPQIVNGLFAICEETYWGLSAHWKNKVGNIPSAQYPYIDLFAAETAEIVAYTYYLFYDELEKFCPEILERIEYELNRRITEPYLQHNDYWWMGYTKRPNNWNPWILSNIMLTLFLVERNPNRIAEGTEKILTELQHYINVMPEDGGCDEGPGYWTRAGLSLFECLDLLKTASHGEIDFLQHPKIRNILAYESKIYIENGYFVNFADGAAYACGVPDSELIYALGKTADLPDMMWLGHELLRFKHNQLTTKDQILDRNSNNVLSRLLRCLVFREETENYTGIKPKSCNVLPDIQVCTVRKGPWFLAAKGGNNSESHNHNDVGTIILFADGQPLLIDVGVGVYTRQTFSPERYTIWTMQSAYHNLPEINGVMQHEGKTFRADSFHCDESSVTVRFASAYESCAGVTDLCRSVSVEEDVTVTDTFVFQDKSDVAEHLMTLWEPKIDGCRIRLLDRYEILCDGGTVTAEKVSFNGDAKLIHAWNQDHVWRIRIAYSGQTKIQFKVRKIKS